MNKFVAWGCKNINSTHSFIHYAYKRAFESMGWESYWLDDSSDISNLDLSNSLFLTLGGQENNMPKRKDCKYILHNCNLSKYNDVDWLALQVYTHDALERDVEKIDNCIYYQKNINTLYQPWATDFLPNEINEITHFNKNRDKVVYWIGSIWNNMQNQGNTNEMQELTNALVKRCIRFENPKKVEYDRNKEFINNSYISPSIQGKWQVNKGYIPCRIFKNISYGEFGITNSETVYNLFDSEIVYDSNIDIMVEKSLNRLENITLNELNTQILEVKNKHTYLNRIENILKLI